MWDYAGGLAVARASLELLAMVVLHGSWLPAQGASETRFGLWAESLDVGASTRRRKPAKPGKGPRPHPFAATAAEIQSALAFGCGRAETAGIAAWLPSRNGAPLCSTCTPDAVEPESASEVEVALWRVDALCLSPADAVRSLLSLAGEAPPDVELGNDVRFWTVAARLALELLYRQRLAPFLERAGDGYVAGWRPLLDDERDRARLATLSRSMPPACRALAWTAAGERPELGAAALLERFIAAAVDSLAREAGAERFHEAVKQSSAGRAAPRRVSPADAWLQALIADRRLSGDPAELARFHERFDAWIEAAGDLSKPADSFRICFRLDPTLDAPDGNVAKAESREHSWNLEYLLQATDDPSLLVPVRDVWRHRGSTARFLNRRFDHPQERLLEGLGRASRLFPPIERSLPPRRLSHAL